MREMSVSEQRYSAVLAVIVDGLTVKDAAAKQGVSRQTRHAWLVKYEDGGPDRRGKLMIHLSRYMRPVTGTAIISAGE